MTDYPMYPEYTDEEYETYDINVDCEPGVWDCDRDIYKQVYRYAHLVDTILSFLTIFSNIFHLSVLVQRELRSISIFALMMGICIADIVGFIFVFYEYAIERFWIYDLLQYFNFENAFVDTNCLSFDYTYFDVTHSIAVALRQAARPISIWLAIFLALIRTLSVMFPMSNWIQTLTKIRAAVVIVLTVGIFWMLYYSWHYVLIEHIWMPAYLHDFCFEPQLVSNISIFAYPRKYDHFVEGRDHLEYLVRAVPALLYPVLTVFLLIELARIRKRRIRMRSTENEKTDNTTLLIVFMTLSFMMSEGLIGAVYYWMGKTDALSNFMLK